MREKEKNNNRDLKGNFNHEKFISVEPYFKKKYVEIEVSFQQH